MAGNLPTSMLGQTGVEVTRLGFGAMELRDSSIKWPIEDAQAELLLNRVLDEGITFIDTADCYGRSCLLYTSPSPRDRTRSRMPSSA